MLSINCLQKEHQTPAFSPHNCPQQHCTEFKAVPASSHTLTLQIIGFLNTYVNTHILSDLLDICDSPVTPLCILLMSCPTEQKVLI